MGHQAQTRAVEKVRIPTPTVVRWKEFSTAFVCLFVCLSAFQHDISRTNATTGSSNLT